MTLLRHLLSSLALCTRCQVNRSGQGWCATWHWKKYSSEAAPQSVPLTPTIGLNREEQKKIIRLKPEQPSKPKFLNVAIIGCANAGKSTLANRLLGRKFAAVSKKVHTTRCKVKGVLTEGSTQVVFLDTPGLVTPAKVKKHQMERSVLVDPYYTLYEADMVVVVVDVSEVWYRTSLDVEVLKALHLHSNKKSILVLNKVDLVSVKQELLQTTRVLTDGVVAGSRYWQPAAVHAKSRRELKLQKMFEQTQAKHEEHGFLKTRHVTTDLDISTDTTDHDINSDTTNSDINSDTTNSDINTETVPSSNTLKSHNQNIVKDDTSSIINDTTLSTNTLKNPAQNVVKGEIAPRATISSESEPLNETVLSISTLKGHTENVIEEGNTTNAKKGSGFKRYTQEELHALRGDWNEFYRELSRIGKLVAKRKGWPGFDRVFMVCSLDGNGVQELKDYLLAEALPGQWQHHGVMVTDQDPIQMATECIKEKLMDHLPQEIPYKTKVVEMLWDIDDDNLLRASFDIICSTNRHKKILVGPGGTTIRRIAAEARESLMDAFQRDLTLYLNVTAKEGQ